MCPACNYVCGACVLPWLTLSARPPPVRCSCIQILMCAGDSATSSAPWANPSTRSLEVRAAAFSSLLHVFRSTAIAEAFSADRQSGGVLSADDTTAQDDSGAGTGRPVTLSDVTASPSTFSITLLSLLTYFVTDETAAMASPSSLAAASAVIAKQERAHAAGSSTPPRSAPAPSAAVEAAGERTPPAPSASPSLASPSASSLSGSFLSSGRWWPWLGEVVTWQWVYLLEAAQEKRRSQVSLPRPLIAAFYCYWF